LLRHGDEREGRGWQNRIDVLAFGRRDGRETTEDKAIRARRQAGESRHGQFLLVLAGGKGEVINSYSRRQFTLNGLYLKVAFELGVDALELIRDIDFAADKHG